MGILNRFGDIIGSNINAALDKLEDPGKMVDQYLRKAMEDFAEVKKETASVMAEEKNAKRNLDKAQAEVDKYMDLAKKAVLAGNDDDAKVFLSKKADAETRVQNAQAIYQTAHANSEKLQQLYNKLADDISSLQARRANVKATVAVAKSQEKVNKFTKGFGASSKGAEGFARMEQAAMARMDAAEAAAELDASGLNDGVDELEKKYSGGGSSSLDAELAALKASMSSNE